MGLDQYLTKRIYIGANFKHRNITSSISLLQDGKEIAVDLSKVSYIEEQIGYWRKANQIHKWFVDNVQNGVDDCGSYDVERDQLKALYDTCADIVSKAKLVKGQLHNGTRWEGGVQAEIYEDGLVVENTDVCEAMPTMSGFFFGSTDYTEWYIQDLKDTMAICEEALKDTEYSEFTYRASW